MWRRECGGGSVEGGVWKGECGGGSVEGGVWKGECGRGSVEGEVWKGEDVVQGYNGGENLWGYYLSHLSLECFNACLHFL